MKHIKILSKTAKLKGPAPAHVASIGEKLNNLLCELATGYKCP